MGKTVAELDQTLGSHELSEWIAYDQLEPFGAQRDDLRIAILSSLTANIHRDPKKRPQAFSHEDFMPFVEREKPNPAKLLKSKLGHLVKRGDPR